MCPRNSFSEDSIKEEISSRSSSIEGNTTVDSGDRSFSSDSNSDLENILNESDDSEENDEKVSEISSDDIMANEITHLNTLLDFCTRAIEDESTDVTLEMLVDFLKALENNTSIELEINASQEQSEAHENLIAKQGTFRKQFIALIKQRADLINTIFSEEVLAMLLTNNANHTQLANVLYLVYSQLEKSTRNDSQFFEKITEKLNADSIVSHEFNRKILTQFFHQKDSLEPDEFIKNSLFSPSLAIATWNSGIGDQKTKGNNYLFSQYCMLLDKQYSRLPPEEQQNAVTDLAQRLKETSPEEFFILATKLAKNVEHPLLREIYKESLKTPGIAEKFIFVPETLSQLSTAHHTGHKKNYATRKFRALAAVKAYLRDNNNQFQPDATKKLAHDLLTSFFHDYKKIKTILETLKEYEDSRAFGEALEKEIDNLLSISLLIDGPEWHSYTNPKNIKTLPSKPAIVLTKTDILDTYEISLIFLNNKEIKLSSRHKISSEEITIDALKAIVISDLTESKIKLVKNPIDLLKNPTNAKELEKKLWFDKGRRLLESQENNPEEIKKCFEKALDVSENASSTQASHRNSIRASTIITSQVSTISRPDSRSNESGSINNDSINNEVVEMIGSESKSSPFNWTIQSLEGVISVLINSKLPKDESLWQFFSNLDLDEKIYSAKERAILIESLLNRLFPSPPSETPSIHDTIWSRAMQFAAEQLKQLETDPNLEHEVKEKINTLLAKIHPKESRIISESDKFQELIELFQTKPITYLEKTAFFLTADIHKQNAAKNMGILLSSLPEKKRNDSINLLIETFITNPEESETRDAISFLVSMLISSDIQLTIKEKIILAVKRQTLEIFHSNEAVQNKNFCALFLDEIITNPPKPDIAKIILMHLSLKSLSTDWKLAITNDKDNDYKKSADFIVGVINSLEDNQIDNDLLRGIVDDLNHQTRMLRAKILGNIFQAKPAIIQKFLEQCKIKKFNEDASASLLQLIFNNITQNKAAGHPYRVKLQEIIFEQIKQISADKVQAFNEKLSAWPEVEEQLITLLKNEQKPKFQHLIVLLSSKKQSDIKEHWINEFSTLPNQALTDFSYAQQVSFLATSKIDTTKKTILEKLLTDKSIYAPSFKDLNDDQLRKILDFEINQIRESTVVIQEFLRSYSLNLDEKNNIYFRILQLAATADVVESNQARAYITPILKREKQAIDLLQNISEATKNKFKDLIAPQQSTPSGSKAIKQYLSSIILSSQQQNKTFALGSFGREYLSSLDFWLFYPDIYAQQLGFRRGASEADEGVYIEYMTEVDAARNKAENSSAKRIHAQNSTSSLPALNKLIESLTPEEQISLLQEATHKINDLKTLNPEHRREIFICYTKQAQKNPALIPDLAKLLIAYFIDENNKTIAVIPKILELLEPASSENDFITEILRSLKTQANLDDLLSPEKINHVANVSDEHLDQWLSVFNHEEINLILVNLLSGGESEKRNSRRLDSEDLSPRETVNVDTLEATIDNPNSQRVRNHIWVRALKRLADNFEPQKFHFMSPDEKKQFFQECIRFTSIVNKENFTNANNNNNTRHFFSTLLTRLKEGTTLTEFITAINLVVPQQQNQEYVYHLCVAFASTSTDLTGKFLARWFLEPNQHPAQQLGILQFINSELIGNTIKADFLKTVLTAENADNLIKNAIIQNLIIKLDKDNANISDIIKVLNDQQRITILENSAIITHLKTETVEEILSTFSNKIKRSKCCQRIVLSNTFSNNQDLEKHKLSFMKHTPFDLLKNNFDTVAGSLNPALLQIITFFTGLLTNQDTETAKQSLFSANNTWEFLDIQSTRWARFYDIVKDKEPFWLNAVTALQIPEDTLQLVLKNLSDLNSLLKEMKDSHSSYQENPSGKIKLSLAIIQYATTQLKEHDDEKMQTYLDDAFEILLNSMEAWQNNDFTPPLSEKTSLSLLKLFDNQLTEYNQLYEATIKKTRTQEKKEYGLLLIPAANDINTIKLPENFTAGYIIHVAQNKNENDQLYYFNGKTGTNLALVKVKPEYQQKFNGIVSNKEITEIINEGILFPEELDEFETYTGHIREDFTPIRVALNQLHQQRPTIEKVIDLHADLFVATFYKTQDHEAEAYWRLCSQMLNLAVFQVEDIVEGTNQGSLVEEPIRSLLTMLLQSKFEQNDRRWVEFQLFFDTIRLKETKNHPLAIEGLAAGLNDLLNDLENDENTIQKIIETIPFESLDWLLRQIITENRVNPAIISALMYRYTLAILNPISTTPQKTDNDHIIFNHINTFIGRQGVYDAVLQQEKNTPFPSTVRAFMIRNLAKDSGGKIPEESKVSLFGTLFQLPESVQDNDWQSKVENALKGLTGQDREAALPVFQALFQYYAHQIPQDNADENARNIRDKFIQTADTIALFFNENIENVLKTCPVDLKVSLLNDELSGLNVHRKIESHNYPSEFVERYCREIFEQSNKRQLFNNPRALSSNDQLHIMYAEDTNEWTIMGYTKNQMDSGQPPIIEYHVTFSNATPNELNIQSFNTENPTAALGESMVQHLSQLRKEIQQIKIQDNDKMSAARKVLEQETNSEAKSRQENKIKELSQQLKLQEVKRCIENTLPSPCDARRERAERVVDGFTRNIAALNDEDPLKEGVIKAITQNNALHQINNTFLGLAVVESITTTTTHVKKINVQDSGKTGTPLDQLRLDFITLKSWLTSPQHVASLDEAEHHMPLSEIINALRARAPFLVKFGKDATQQNRERLETQLRQLPPDSEQRLELEEKIKAAKRVEERAKQFSGDDFIVAVMNDLRRNIKEAAQNQDTQVIAQKANRVLSEYICEEFQNQSTSKSASEWVSRGLEQAARWMIGGDVAQCESILSHLLPKQSLNVAKVWKAEQANIIDNETALYVRQNGKMEKIASVKQIISEESNLIGSQSNIRQYELKWLDNTTEKACEYYQAIGERDRLLGIQDDIQALIDLNRDKEHPFHSVYGHLPSKLTEINQKITEREETIKSLEEQVKNQDIHLQEGTALYDEKGNYVGSLSEQFHLSQDVLYGKKTWYDILLNQPISQWEKTGDTIYIPILDVINRGLLSDFYKDIVGVGLSEEKTKFLKTKIFGAIFTAKPALSIKDCEQLVKYLVTNDVLALFKQYNQQNDPSGTSRKALLQAMLLSPRHMPYFMENEDKQLQLWRYLNRCKFSESEMNRGLLMGLKNKIPSCPYAEALSQVVRVAYFTAHGLGSEIEEFRMEKLSSKIIETLPVNIKKLLFEVPENFDSLQQETYFKALSKGLSENELKNLFREFLKNGFNDQKTHKQSMYTTKGLLAFYRNLGEDVFWEVFNAEVPLNSSERNQWVKQGIFGNSAFMQALAEDLGTNSLMKLITHDVSRLPDKLGIRERTPDRYMSFSMNEMIELIKYYKENPSEELQDFLADWLFLQLQSGEWIQEDATSSDLDESYLNSLTWNPDLDESIELTEKAQKPQQNLPQNTGKVARLNTEQLNTLTSLVGNKAFTTAMKTKYPLYESNLEKLVKDKAQKSPNDFSTFYDKENNQKKFIPDAANLKISLSLTASWDNHAWVSVKAIDYALLESARQMKADNEGKARETWKEVLHDYIGSIREPWNLNTNKNKKDNLSDINQQLSEIRTTVVRLLSSGGKIGHSSEDTLKVLLDKRNFLLLMDMYEISKNESIQEEIQTILLAMFVANPQMFLSQLSQFDRKNEWNFAVKLLKALPKITQGQTNEEFDANQQNRKTNRSISIVQNMLGLIVLGGAGGATLAKNTGKGAIIGAGLGAAAGTVIGGIHTTLGWIFDTSETGIKSANDSITAIYNGINTKQLNAARNIFKDKTFEEKQECEKKGWKTGFKAGYRRIQYYQPNIFFTSIHAIGLYLGLKAEPTSNYGVPSYRESIPNVYIGNETMTIKGNAIHLIPKKEKNIPGYSCSFYHDGVKESQESVWISQQFCNNLITQAPDQNNTILKASDQKSDEQKKAFSLMLKDLENHRNKTILQDESNAKEGYYGSRTYVTSEQTKTATHQAIQSDLSQGEFNHLKEHLAIKTPGTDSKKNITDAKASITSLLAAIDLANLAPNSGTARVSDKAIYTVPRGWMDRLWHGTTGWFTGKCTIEKKNLQALKTMLNDILQEEAKATTENAIIDQVKNLIQGSKDTHIQLSKSSDKNIQLLETVITDQTPMMNNLMNELNNAKKMDVFKEKLMSVQSHLMSLVTTAMKIKLLTGETASENKAVHQVKQYTKELQTLMQQMQKDHHPSAQKIQDMLTDITFQCSHVSERLLITRLENLEKILVHQNNSIVEQEIKILQKDQWIACKAILEVYPEDKAIRDKFNVLSTQLKLHNLEQMLSCELETSLKTIAYPNHKWLMMQKEYTPEIITYAMKTDVSNPPASQPDVSVNDTNKSPHL